MSTKNKHLPLLKKYSFILIMIKQDILKTAFAEILQESHNSPHDTNKIAAGLLLESGALLSVQTNYFPDRIKDNIDENGRFGNTSGSIHAETAVLLNFNQTQKRSIPDNTAMLVTDPPCPNCIKNMIIAGIKNIYIDHDGFEKDFAQRRLDDFRNLSIPIATAHGVRLFETFVDTGLCVPLNTIAMMQRPIYEQAQNLTIPLDSWIENLKDIHKNTAFVAVQITDPNALELPNQALCVTQRDLMRGLESDKYTSLVEPLTGLFMLAARFGFEIKNPVYSSRIPSARELVNAMGIEGIEIQTDNYHPARDAESEKIWNMFYRPKCMV
jgi:deoxycytidylate deaminase